FRLLWFPVNGVVPWPLEKIGGIRSNAKAFADVLATAVQAIVDGPRHQVGIECQTAYGRIEKIRLFLGQCADNVLDRDVVLIATLGLAQSVLQHALPALANSISVCL